VTNLKWFWIPLLLAWLISPVVLTSETEANLVLVQDGRPNATIVLEENPTVSAQLAAHELQYHLREMAGAVLPIVHEPQRVNGNRVLVGDSRSNAALGYRGADFEQSAFLVEATTDRLVLIGRDTNDRQSLDYGGDLGPLCQYHSMTQAPLGTCHAVHTFLEKTLGVRWYLPTPLGEVIPARSTVTVAPMTLRRGVSAPHRTTYPYAINRKLFYDDYTKVDWQHDDHWDLRSGVLYWIRHKNWGGPPFKLNHSFVNWDDAFGQDHPQWFSTKSWEKMQKLDYQFQTNPCLSQEGLFQANLEIIRAFYDGKPEPFTGAYWSAGGRYFGICLNDNGSWCRCQPCVAQYRPDMGQQGTLSNYFWNYVNRLARAAAETHPQARLIGLAYSDYTAPPRGIRFAPNVGVMICRMPYRYWHTAYQRQDYDAIRAFVEQCGATTLFTWEYLIHPWAESYPFVPVIPRINATDARFLAGMPAFGGGYMQLQINSVKRNGEHAGLIWSHPVIDHFRLYFRMKLYDDPSLEVDALLSEYYETFYGPAAPQVRAFVEALEDRWCDPAAREASGAFPHEYGSSNARVWWRYLGTEEFMQRARTLMAAALEAAPPETIYAQRVKLLDRGVLQLLENNRTNYLGTGLAKLPPVPELEVTIGPTPRLDGLDDDPAWQSASWQAITRTNMNQGATSRSRFKVVADERTLYLLVECSERATESIVALMEGDGPAVLSDDSIELFIAPEPSKGAYFQLGYNTLGSVFELALDRNGTTNATAAWKGGTRARVTMRANEHWTAEIAIPWPPISGGHVQAGETWRLNVCRNRQAGNRVGESPASGDNVEFTNWSVCGGGFHNPDRFGRIRFVAASAGHD